VTTPVYLVRHAKARNRLRWTQPDHLRPLTKAGRRQAGALVDLFGEQPFTRLLTSPFVRCVETLEPLAQARGLPLETADALAEGAFASAALELVLETARNGPAAFCTHGDVLMWALDDLAAAGVTLEDPLAYKKGATWILEVEDGAFVRGRYVGPPLSTWDG
jgi:8-oxo-dGTP diphosphatase